MGKHTLESKNLNQWRPDITHPGERRHAFAPVESAITTTETNGRFARNLGETTIDAAFTAIVENFEVKRPTLKERLRRIGKNILRLAQSVHFEKHAETQHIPFTNDEKEAIFAADRERAQAQAREDVARHFRPRQTEAGAMIIDEQVDTSTPEQEDDLITSFWANDYDGVSYDNQAIYQDIRYREATNNALDHGPSPTPRVHLLTHRISTPLNPLEDSLRNMHQIARMRVAADRAEYAKRNIPIKNNMYRPPNSAEAPAEELLGLTK